MADDGSSFETFADVGFYFSINEIDRWMKSVRFLPFSMPLVRRARSMICLTSLVSDPISRSRWLRSSRSVTTFFESSSRVDFSSGVRSASFLSVSYTHLTLPTRRAV